MHDFFREKENLQQKMKDVSKCTTYSNVTEVEGRNIEAKNHSLMIFPRTYKAI